MKNYWNIFLARWKWYIQELKKQPPTGALKDWDSYWDEKGSLGGVLRADAMLSFLKEGDEILDLGCGDGSLINHLLTITNGIKATGVDISSQALRTLSPKAKKIQANILDIDFSIEMKYDYIILSEVLEHIAEAEIVIEKVHDHFRKNLAISIPNAGYFIHRLRALVGRVPIINISFSMSEHIRHWTIKDFYYWADRNGLRVMKVVPLYGSTFGYRYRNTFLSNLWPSLFSMSNLFLLARKNCAASTVQIKNDMFFS